MLRTRPQDRKGAILLSSMVTLCLCLAVGAFPGSALAASSADATSIIVTHSPGYSIGCDAWGSLQVETDSGSAQPDEELGRRGVEVVGDLSPSDSRNAVVVATVPQGADAEELARGVASLPGVESASPDVAVSALDDEASLRDLLGLNDPYYLDGKQYNITNSRVVEAWRTSRCQGQVEVAVLDTGCLLDHEDLKDNVDTTYAYDVTHSALLTSAESVVGQSYGGDRVGHGTHVCGIISARVGNGKGIAGASYNAKVLPIKVFDDSNSTSGAKVSSIIAGLNYVYDLVTSGRAPNLKIVNMSLGFYGSLDSQPALEQTVRRLRDVGVLCVCAGGNNGRTDTMLPSDYPECLSVTSLDRLGHNAALSDYNQAKDLSAPGEDIYSAYSWGTDSYHTLSGSSQAAPLVSGIAGLLWACDPSLSVDAVVSTLESTATPVSDLARDRTSTSGSHGCVDAAAAVSVVASNKKAAAEQSERQDMYRLYNPNSGEHFYTAATSERDHLVSVGWRYEGVGWTAPKASGNPVYRLYNPNAGDHHYTVSTTERDHLVSVGWRYEGVGWQSAPASGKPLYRQYNPNARAGAHNYTTSATERDHLVGLGWRDEGIGWYGVAL